MGQCFYNDILVRFHSGAKMVCDKKCENIANKSEFINSVL